MFSSPKGGFEADPDDREEREAVRHGAAVPAHAVPAHAQRALLHAACRAAHVPARPGHQRDLLRGPLSQGTLQTFISTEGFAGSVLFPGIVSAKGSLSKTLDGVIVFHKFVDTQTEILSEQLLKVEVFDSRYFSSLDRNLDTWNKKENLSIKDNPLSMRKSFLLGLTVHLVPGRLHQGEVCGRQTSQRTAGLPGWR